MIQKRTEHIGNKLCYLYESGEPEMILIQPIGGHDMDSIDNEVEHIIESSDGMGFILAAFMVDDWNAELSPWNAPPVFGDEAFGCGAGETLRYVIDEFLPVIKQGRELPICIGGYSLAGFFALWSAYQTDLFKGVVAASPSVWFPGWIELAQESFVKTERVYLSIGDKEEKTRNPVMRTVGDNIRKQYELLESDPGCKECMLEMNKGNHFKDADLRTAKGFAWILKRNDAVV